MAPSRSLVGLLCLTIGLTVAHQVAACIFADKIDPQQMAGVDRRLLGLFPTEYPAFNITSEGKNVDINITGDGTLIKKAADPPLPPINITALKERLGLEPRDITLTKPDLNINKTGEALNLNITKPGLNISADPAHGDPAMYIPINCTVEGQFIPFNIPAINVTRSLPCTYSGYARPFNFTNLPAASVNAAMRAAATGQSIGEYVGNVAPSRIMDLLTPVGNFTDVAVYVDAATAYSPYIPGAIRYSVNSVPEILDELQNRAYQKLANFIEYTGLDPTYARIFDSLRRVVNPTITGLALRLAFHDAASYDPNGQVKGGANGSIRYEFDRPSNAGLQRFMWPSIWAAKQVLDRVLPKPVSYADLSAIAGAVGIFNTGGPLINVGYGRPDVDVADPNQGVGSNTNQQKDYPIAELLNEWSHYGFTPEDLVVLSGGHSIGFSASTNPQGTINANDRRFTNNYYRQVILGDAFFASDKALANNNDTLAIVQNMAADENLFYTQFTKRYTTLTWLGVDPSVTRRGL